MGDTDTLFRMALRYPMAYCPVPKAVYHMEAENRSDLYLYSGNYPFFKHAREYLAESPENRVLDEDVAQYVAFYETQSLRSNWLAGNRAAMREIVADCGDIKGYRLTCLWWRVMSWIPRPLVELYIKLRCRVARLVGRSGRWPPVRDIYRAHDNTEPCIDRGPDRSLISACPEQGQNEPALLHRRSLNVPTAL